MVNCSYCNKELDRKVFCSNSHKVMFHVRTPGVSDPTKYINKYHTSTGFEDFNPQPKPKKGKKQ